MVLPPEEAIDSETAIENLIDTSDTGSLTGDQLDSTNTRNGSLSPDALTERYVYLFFLNTRREMIDIVMTISESRRVSLYDLFFFSFLKIIF